MITAWTLCEQVKTNSLLIPKQIQKPVKHLWRFHLFTIFLKKFIWLGSESISKLVDFLLMSQFCDKFTLASLDNQIFSYVSIHIFVLLCGNVKYLVQGFYELFFFFVTYIERWLYILILIISAERLNLLSVNPTKNFKHT